MDVIEELDLSTSFILAISIYPEINTEYRTVLITCDLSLGCKPKLGRMIIDNFPHILDRPWTPSDVCVEADGVKITAYNGFITNIATSKLHVWKTDSGWYDSYSEMYNDQHCCTTNPNNLLIGYTMLNLGMTAYTKFGTYVKGPTGKIYYEALERVMTTKLVRHYQLEKTYYTVDGTPVNGIYNGVLHDNVPVGLNHYHIVPNPTIQTVEYSGIESTLVPWDKKPPIQHNIPIIKSLADLIENFPHF